MWSSGCPINLSSAYWNITKASDQVQLTPSIKEQVQKPVLEYLAGSKMGTCVMVTWGMPWKQYRVEQIASRVICSCLSVYPSFTLSAGSLIVLRAIRRNVLFSTSQSLKALTNDYMLEVFGHSTRDSVALAALVVHWMDGMQSPLLARLVLICILSFTLPRFPPTLLLP